MENKLRTYQVVTPNGLHCGPIKRTLPKGTVIRSDGVSFCELMDKTTFTLPALEGVIKTGWIKLVDDSTIQDAPIKTEASRDSDKVFEESLKKAGMNSDSTVEQKTATLDEVKTKETDGSKSKTGIPKEWPFNEHWKKRQKELEKINDLNVLFRLKKFYENSGFEGHVIDRINQLKAGSPQTFESLIEDKPNNIKKLMKSDAGENAKNIKDMIGGEIDLSSTKAAHDTINNKMEIPERNFEDLSEMDKFARKIANVDESNAPDTEMPEGVPLDHIDRQRAQE